MFWKTARHLLNQGFVDKLENYTLMGAKEDTFKAYQTINFIEKNLEGIDQAEVDDYNMVIGRLFKWL